MARASVLNTAARSRQHNVGCIPVGEASGTGDNLVTRERCAGDVAPNLGRAAEDP